jgi:hypothetical protein
MVGLSANATVKEYLVRVLYFERPRVKLRALVDLVSSNCCLSALCQQLLEVFLARLRSCDHITAPWTAAKMSLLLKTESSQVVNIFWTEALGSGELRKLGGIDSPSQFRQHTLETATGECVSTLKNLVKKWSFDRPRICVRSRRRWLSRQQIC